MDENLVCELLGRSIKRFRNRYKWSQEVLAEKIDISSNFLSNIENGKAWVSPKTVAKLASTFKVSPYELFMPENNLPAASANILSQYNQDVKELLHSALDEIRDRYVGQNIGEGGVSR
jgi:transcriptional regulator with XRE-family HTH domain